MKFARVGLPGAEVPALFHEGKYYSLWGVTADIDAEFWKSGGPAESAAALASGSLPELSAGASARNSRLANEGAADGI